MKLFTYSDEVAKKNFSNLTILKIIILIIISATIYMIFPIIGIILIVFSIIYIINQLDNNSVDINEKARSYAIDANGKIYEINFLHGFNNAGASGQLIGGNVGGLIGSVQDIKALENINNNIDIIYNPESVSKLIETKPEQIVNIVEILKVYSIKEYKRYFEVNCDLMVLTNENKIYNQTNLKIKKCYTDYNLLIEELKKKIN